jgi:outer membrane protein assembly factor BamA
LLGGDNSFVRAIYSWCKYNKFMSNGVFASRIKLGWVAEFGRSKEVPTKERFYLGGAYTVRGFSENALGPADSTGNPAGGEAIGLLNLELRKPIFWQIWGPRLLMRLQCEYQDVSFVCSDIGRVQVARRSVIRSIRQAHDYQQLSNRWFVPF